MEDDPKVTICDNKFKMRERQIIKALGTKLFAKGWSDISTERISTERSVAMGNCRARSQRAKERGFDEIDRSGAFVSIAKGELHDDETQPHRCLRGRARTQCIGSPGPSRRRQERGRRSGSRRRFRGRNRCLARRRPICGPGRLALASSSLGRRRLASSWRRRPYALVPLAPGSLLITGPDRTSDGTSLRKGRGFPLWSNATGLVMAPLYAESRRRLASEFLAVLLKG